MKVREKRSVSTHTQREMADKVVVMIVLTGDDDDGDECDGDADSGHW